MQPIAAGRQRAPPPRGPPGTPGEGVGFALPGGLPPGDPSRRSPGAARPIGSPRPAVLPPAGAARCRGTERDRGPPRPQGAGGKPDTGARGEVGSLWGPRNPASSRRGRWVGFPRLPEEPPCCPRLDRPRMAPEAGGEAPAPPLPPPPAPNGRPGWPQMAAPPGSAAPRSAALPLARCGGRRGVCN